MNRRPASGTCRPVLPSEEELCREIERDRNLEIQVPASFPDKYLPALIRAADQCKVKQHLENPPEITTVTRVVA